MARNHPIFFKPEGGFYNLQINLGVISDARVRLAMQILWAHPDLRGPLKDYERQPWEQPVWAELDYRADSTHYWGVATVPNGSPITCVALVYRQDFPSEPPMCDVLEFSLALSSLSEVYPVGGFPFDGELYAQSWELEVDAWLLGIARYVYEKLPFPSGAIGFELLGNATKEPKLNLHGYLADKGGTLKWTPPRYYPPSE